MPGPPPPPPMGRGVNRARVAPSGGGGGGGAPDKGALLAAIRTGTNLKKTVTNDRSNVIGAGMLDSRTCLHTNVVHSLGKLQKYVIRIWHVFCLVSLKNA